MFPLGSVLFPHVLLPLRVFEPRYRVMIAQVLATDGEFGVALIERGSEVGGGDRRTSVATRARVVRAGENADGTWFVAAVGTGRLRVAHWFADDPFPRADTEEWPDDTGPVDGDVLAPVVARLRLLLALKAELGDPVVDSTVSLSDDPEMLLWQACAVAPVGPFDNLALLQAPGAVARLALLAEFVDEETTVARQRLAG